ncbi:MAG: hypothetical protein IPK24_11195 [Kineosporiaceae bacterium]|nr:hypothetical protein [Kineosporiaceae bacterium]
MRVALNLESPYASRFFQERMDSLGRAIDRERRTAVRRVDDALNLLAEMLDRSAPRVAPRAHRRGPGQVRLVHRRLREPRRW